MVAGIGRAGKRRTNFMPTSAVKQDTAGESSLIP